MAAASDALPSRRWENRFLILLFCGAVLFHAWGASVGWKSLNLPGCEFRQTQTALSAFFIQKEHNYSLAYPTPVLGKPWSIPLEFPLYQWTVAWVSDHAGLPLTQAGRAVSLLCFYLTLPALYLLLARIGLPRGLRLLALGLVLTCPLYILYARSFLIETMALMFGAWFLLGYGRTVERRSWSWLALTAGCGALCGLVKVTTLLFFLLPALLWTCWWFWRDWQRPAGERGRSVRWRIVGCALAVVVPFGASIWWVHYSDAVKAVSVAGNFLISKRMMTYNFGTEVRFSPALWQQHWHVLFNDLTSVPVLAGAGLLAVFFARRWWAMIAILVSLFFLVQAIFPILYAWHEYYYVACAFMLMLAIGLVLCGLWESRVPRLVVWLFIVGAYGLQAWSYLSYYYPGQRQISQGGSNVTYALRQVTAPDEVIVVAGDDWNSMTPYYAQRRALMIRRDEEHSWDIMVPAFKRLAGEEVTALVLYDEQAKNQTLIKTAGDYFHIDPRPAFRWRNVTVLLHEQIRRRAMAQLKNIPDLEIFDAKPDEVNPDLRREIETNGLLRRFQENFSAMSPVPFKHYTTFGIDPIGLDGRTFYNAHPDTRLWFKVPAGRHVFLAETGIMPGAYDEKLAAWDQTDGIEVRLEKELPGGQRELIFSQVINPRERPADRGIQSLSHSFALERDGVVVLSLGPGPHANFTRDWAILGRVEIK